MKVKNMKRDYVVKLRIHPDMKKCVDMEAVRLGLKKCEFYSFVLESYVNKKAKK